MLASRLQDNNGFNSYHTLSRLESHCRNIVNRPYWPARSRDSCQSADQMSRQSADDLARERELNLSTDAVTCCIVAGVFIR